MGIVTFVLGQFVSDWFDVRDWFGLLGNNEPVVASVTATPSVSQQFVVAPTASASATPIPKLVRMLNEAKVIPYNEDRVNGLETVAEAAVKEGGYPIAIEAGASTPRGYGEDQARILTFVARCAYDEGLFEIAYQAAGEIDYESYRSEVINEILHAEKWWPYGVNPPDNDLASVTCFR